MPGSRGARREGRSFKLKPADPFELIRWLARSQSDPRKAVAELVQNSLDAGARQVVVERIRVKGALTLRVRDDGEGVVPDREREDALMHIATNIGHSHKLGLDPSERRARVVAGKYGVGLLGFWSIGKQLELRSRVAGSPLWVLRLEEDSPRAEVVRHVMRTDAPATYTEVVVGPVHAASQKALGGRRLSEYLAGELRGQILMSGAEVVVHDRVARGSAQKRFVVAPRRFSGERLALPNEIEVVGYPAVRVELYVARGAERPAVQLACAGTLVADDISEVAAFGIHGAPWTGCELTGLLDFAAFSIPPGSRRGVLPDAAAMAFLTALAELEPLVLAELAHLERERREAADRNVVRELRRALRGLQTRLPHYDLPTVRGERDGDGDGGAAAGEPAIEPPVDEGEPAGTMPLFPAGPLAAVRIAPQRVRITPGSERRVRATATDAEGRCIEDVAFEWRLPDGARTSLSVRGAGARPALVAEPDAPLGARVALLCVATQAERSASDLAEVIVADDQRADSSGIPEPYLVSDAEGNWRSRMHGERWEVNEAHRDYLGVRDEPRGRMRYLLALLAKEIVLRSSGRHESSDVLESMAEVLAHAERNLRGK